MNILVPLHEQEKEWFKPWKKIIEARQANQKVQEPSPLLNLFFNATGIYTWKTVKTLTEFALKHAKDAHRIFSAKHKSIKKSNSPDEIILEFWAELRAIIILDLLGFKGITHQRENDLDFKVYLGQNVYFVEVTYMHGPNFKTQVETDFQSSDTEVKQYRLNSSKLIIKLKNIYEKKEEQILKHGYAKSDSIIMILTDLEETYYQWFDHESKHPIQSFVDDQEIPTIVIGAGTSFYVSKKLSAITLVLDRDAFIKIAYGANVNNINL